MNPMRNANYFKLRLFSANTGGGTAFTKGRNRWFADGPEFSLKSCAPGTDDRHAQDWPCGSGYFIC
jgi:hypothetical protein